MTEEEYFRKNFPDSCYGDKPLSPHWDYFQFGVEFGERESEEKIKELEQNLAQTEKDLADYQFNYPTIKELQKENAELKKLKRECETSLCRAEYQYNYEQLTKAKTLLQKVADICGYPNYDIPVELYADIEHFISEVKK